MHPDFKKVPKGVEVRLTVFYNSLRLITRSHFVFALLQLQRILVLSRPD